MRAFILPCLLVFTVLGSSMELFGQSSKVEKTVTPFKTIYSDSRGTVQIGFLLFPCSNKSSFRRYRFHNTLSLKNSYVEGKFDYIDCDGKRQTERFNADLNKLGIDDDSGYWTGNIKEVTNIYDIKLKDYSGSGNRDNGSSQDNARAEQDRIRQQELTAQREREVREAEQTRLRNEERRRQEELANAQDARLQNQIDEIKDPVTKQMYESNRQNASRIKDPEERKRFLELQNQNAARSNSTSQAVDAGANLLVDMLTMEVDGIKGLAKGEMVLLLSGGVNRLLNPYFTSNTTTEIAKPQYNLSVAMDLLCVNGFGMFLDYNTLKMNEPSFSMQLKANDGNWYDYYGHLKSNASQTRLGLGYNLSTKNRVLHLLLTPTISYFVMDDEYGWENNNTNFQIEDFKTDFLVWGMGAKVNCFLGNRFTLNLGYYYSKPFADQEGTFYKFSKFSNAQLGLAFRFF